MTYSGLLRLPQRQLSMAHGLDSLSSWAFLCFLSQLVKVSEEELARETEGHSARAWGCDCPGRR